MFAVYVFAKFALGVTKLRAFAVNFCHVAFCLPTRLIVLFMRICREMGLLQSFSRGFLLISRDCPFLDMFAYLRDNVFFLREKVDLRAESSFTVKMVIFHVSERFFKDVYPLAYKGFPVIEAIEMA